MPSNFSPRDRQSTFPIDRSFPWVFDGAACLFSLPLSLFLFTTRPLIRLGNIDRAWFGHFRSTSHVCMHSMCVCVHKREAISIRKKCSRRFQYRGTSTAVCISLSLSLPLPLSAIKSFACSGRSLSTELIFPLPYILFGCPLLFTKCFCCALFPMLVIPASQTVLPLSLCLPHQSLSGRLSYNTVEELCVFKLRTDGSHRNGMSLCICNACQSVYIFLLFSPSLSLSFSSPSFHSAFTLTHFIYTAWSPLFYFFFKQNQFCRLSM